MWKWVQTQLQLSYCDNGVCEHGSNDAVQDCMMLQKSAQVLLQKSVQMLRAKPEETPLQNSAVQTT
jgi:hypothetical protein